MAKLIIAIEIPEEEAIKIDQESKIPVKLGYDELPSGSFNPDGRIALDPSKWFEEDEYDDFYYVFEYRGVERENTNG